MSTGQAALIGVIDQYVYVTLFMLIVSTLVPFLREPGPEHQRGA